MNPGRAEEVGMVEKTILAVDDDPSILIYLEEVLRQEGYRVLTADGAEAVRVLLDTESPDLLLLDEAGAGLNAAELAALMAMLRRLSEEKKVTLCVVEHVMPMVMGLCERIIVLDSGKLIAEGSPGEISSNQRVIEAYLGERALR